MDAALPEGLAARLCSRLRAHGPVAWLDAPALLRPRAGRGAPHGAPNAAAGQDDARPSVDAPASGGERRTAQDAPFSVLLLLDEPREDTETSWRAGARTALSLEPDPRSPLLGARVGWFSYEAGAWFTPMPAPVAEGLVPRAWSARVMACVPVAGPTSGPGRRDDARTCPVVALDEDVARMIRAVLAKLLSETATEEPADPTVPVGFDAVKEHPEAQDMSVTPREDHHGDDARGAYEAGVNTVLAHLRAGDCYQVNLARHVDIPGCDEAGALRAWRTLRARNAARRGMLLLTEHGAVVCNSPELLLEVRGRRMLSVPIKGTAPRGARRAERLLRDDKERAELRMIVDLVRADFGRVARPGTVQAARRRVGPVGHVLHAMQRVTATLDDSLDATDAFAAVFPAGSVTGAPRMRAMEVLHRLERAPRGVYCGSLGMWLPGGDAWWNVAIRTITVAQGRARLHVGAGIVIGSAPTREFEETTLKAARMLEVLT